jgi:hypothetical protein
MVFCIYSSPENWQIAELEFWENHFRINVRCKHRYLYCCDVGCLLDLDCSDEEIPQQIEIDFVPRQYRPLIPQWRCGFIKIYIPNPIFEAAFEYRRRLSIDEFNFLTHFDATDEMIMDLFHDFTSQTGVEKPTPQNIIDWMNILVWDCEIDDSIYYFILIDFGDRFPFYEGLVVCNGECFERLSQGIERDCEKIDDLNFDMLCWFYSKFEMKKYHHRCDVGKLRDKPLCHSKTRGRSKSL